MSDPAARSKPVPALLWVLLAAAGTFALTMGARQSMGLFLGPLNTATGLGLASISLAFAFGQLWWGLTQPIAGIVADRIGAGRVLVLGIGMVALGTALIPFMTSTLGLVLAIGVLAAGGAGMAGPAVLMSATTRLVAPEKRGMATGIVNAGGSFGQFVFAPIAQGISARWKERGRIRNRVGLTGEVQRVLGVGGGLIEENIRHRRADAVEAGDHAGPFLAGETLGR